MIITDTAKAVLEEVLKENKAEGIRFYSEAGGCCGPQVGLSLDAPEAKDRIEVINGIQVALDEEVAPLATDLTLDHQEAGDQAGFVLLGVSDCC
ncbi:Fe-S cluster assembly iron-binding protein IscA [Bacillus ectoiniformans]|uniref:adhesin n=1 Tax=Bacillus ectoiniformans TaxID=1494429 RepID=UPI00195E4D4E|nr:adhesin [Bacillus ectoiniformans]MBM7647388.1 Fe-S cluster assembly iron-binding protein IscA [Bacillus ectoiniformans]